MTDIGHSLQHEAIQEELHISEPETEEASIQKQLEEGDITEAVPNMIHIHPKPTPSHELPERLHNNGDSESEEDVTEEHYDTTLTNGIEQLSIHSQSSERVSINSVEIEEPTVAENERTQVNGIVPEVDEEDDDDNQPLSANLSYRSRAEQEPNVHPTSANMTASSTRGRSVSSASPTTTSGLLPRSQRVWEMDRQAPECRRCHRRFNFLVRRHHCRRCGQIVCDRCSSNRIRLPVEELIEDPMVSPSQYPLLASQSQRVCDTCYREPIRRSSDSQQRRGRGSNSRPVNVNRMQRTDSSQSLMIDCPVCGQTFLGMQKGEQEDHLQRCLNVGSPPVQSPRYIVYELSEESTQIGDECPICFDEFEQGNKISRMICLCSYHQHCLASWLQRGKGCPVHYDSLQV